MKPEPPMARPPVPAVAFKPEWAAFQAKQTVVTGVRSEIAASWQRSMQSNLSATLPGPPLDEAALRGFDHGGTAASSSSPPAASWPIGWCPSSATRPPRSLSATTSAWSSTGPADRRCCAPPSTSIWCREASGLSRRPVRTGSGSRSSSGGPRMCTGRALPRVPARVLLGFASARIAAALTPKSPEASAADQHAEGARPNPA